MPFRSLPLAPVIRSISELSCQCPGRPFGQWVRWHGRTLRYWPAQVNEDILNDLQMATSKLYPIIIGNMLTKHVYGHNLAKGRCPKDLKHNCGDRRWRGEIKSVHSSPIFECSASITRRKLRRIASQIHSSNLSPLLPLPRNSR